MNGSAHPRRLLLSFAAILFLTGSAKILSSFGSAKLLAEPDPIVGINFSHLMLITGLLELAAAFTCWRGIRHSRNVKPAAHMVAWLSTVILGYRLGLWYMGWRRPCHCLGNLTDALHIPDEVADDLMKAMLAYLLICSYGLLIWQWRCSLTGRKPALGVPGEAS